MVSVASRTGKARRCRENPALTALLKYGKLLPVVQDMQCATVAQLVEQLTRNEQVACSNQVSSSRAPRKLACKASFRGFLFVRQGMEKWALVP